MRVSRRGVLALAVLGVFVSSLCAQLEITVIEDDDRADGDDAALVISQQQREMLQVALADLPLGEDEEEEAFQLLKPAAGHDRLEVNEVVLEKLAAIKEPVSLVSIVGPYHSGKSFLLNVLMNSTRGFTVGAKPDPETRGVWIRILPKEKLRGVDGSRVVLLDTEGFYGDGASRLYDARIFAVSTLISSHLVYNTLRTIGDAQSVSSLADLSKQAQVFNLQNWLHTAHATAETTSSIDVDPFLLLETLKFPPLTWVVQGFDMDLNPATSPVKYLQKFIAAHAQTGDMTLDTLFSQGISCYTLRTPTDMNSLRDQVGGEGLAADTELFDALHPKYVSDLDSLRQGVFGDLKAKGDGNFTGRNVARLIPLLVHYVNEDFPLNADRKLRDVLADIIAEGSFSGGVQYFQLSMEAFSKASKQKMKGKLPASEMPDSDAALKSLAASALTTEELERVLTFTERKSIDYCKRRCVGVPEELAKPICETQLAIKIERMKTQYREENDRKVKEVLVLLGERLRASAVKQIEGLVLPMLESDIGAQCTRAEKNVTRRYDSLAGPHKGSHLYTEAKNQMQEDIQLKCDRVKRLNEEKISGILKNAEKTCRQAYESSIRAGGFTGETGQKPFSVKKLQDLNLAAVASGKSAYANAVKSESTWIGHLYQPYRYHEYECVEYCSKQRYSELQAQNELNVKAFCDVLETQLEKRYKDEVNRFSPFPDNDETITAKAETLGKQLLQEYTSAVKDFTSVPTVDEKRKELSYRIGEARDHLLKKNTALMAAFCYDPLMDAYKELRMQDCESGNMFKSWSFWSAKCLWPGPRYVFGFKHAAHSVARKHLDMAESSGGSDSTKGVVLSPGTRNKVIQAWIEHDLAPASNVVTFNFAVLSAFVVGTMGFVYFLLRFSFGGSGGGHRGDRGGGYKAMDGVQWSHYETRKSSPNVHYRRY
ncbi:guanylate-binding protein 1 [Selaginella moellendorffii]|uniref:guanylate-binding protein 1 n=1 Tax=Selaginella moellendorffii TaxID=88036 RepID=UPI000D1CB443|nr:guanylate-binding protein 1 [Selaginella moellendorffii]|eukprot:XP_002975882.2 guanylate-binding protein 1 [Selaginella moellendorffii]